MISWNTLSALLEVSSVVSFTFASFLWARASEVLKERDFWNRIAMFFTDVTTDTYLRYSLQAEVADRSHVETQVVRGDIHSLLMALDKRFPNLYSDYEKAREIVRQQEQKDLAVPEQPKKLRELATEWEQRNEQTKRSFGEILADLQGEVTSAQRRSSGLRRKAMILFIVGSTLFILSKVPMRWCCY